MRILVATNFHPIPPSDGMQLHLYALLSELRRRHEVLLISPRPERADVDTTGLASLCSDHIEYALSGAGTPISRLASEFRTAFSGRSKFVDSVLRSPLRETVAQSVASFKPDVVHLQSGAAAAIAPIRGTPTVAAPLDADDLNALARIEAARGPISRWLAQREATRFSHFEAEAYAMCDRTVVVTDRDAAALRKLNPALRPTVIPNGIDTVMFSPGSIEASTSTIVFHGAMDYEPNVDAAQFLVQEILPIVKDRHPYARVVLAGRRPSRAVRDLSNGDVQVTGELESMVPVLRDATVYVCPMRVGSGIKNKLLEAMACGRAIVATRLATSGIPIEAGVHALVEEQAQTIASAISDVLEDFQLRLRLGQAARELAEQRSWASCAEEFETVYAEASAGSRIEQ